MSEKVYIRGYEQFRNLLERAIPEGTEFTWVDASRPIDEQAEELKDAVGVFTMPSVFPVELAQKCPRLKLVQVFSAGTEQIDKAALGELGIKVSNNNGGNSPAVAEHAVTLMVSVYRKLNQQFQSVGEGKWAGDFMLDWFPQTFELTGKTVGIVGLGRIGKQVARRLQGWDCELIYNDIEAIPPEVEAELNITGTSLDELLQTSDIVTLHVPLTQRARGMIGKNELEMMKPSAIIISTCRGPVIDEAALIEALNEGKITAAGLDVTAQEPPDINNPLLHMDNVVVSPHLAGLSWEAAQRSCAFAVENVRRVERGEEPESVVLPD